jgi:hypothetical protein
MTVNRLCRVHDTMHKSFCCCLWNAFEHIACSDDLFVPYAGPLTPVKRIGPSWNPKGCTMHRGAVVTFLQTLGHSSPDVDALVSDERFTTPAPSNDAHIQTAFVSNLVLHHSWVRAQSFSSRHIFFTTFSSQHASLKLPVLCRPLHLPARAAPTRC